MRQVDPTRRQRAGSGKTRQTCLIGRRAGPSMNSGHAPSRRRHRMTTPIMPAAENWSEDPKDTTLSGTADYSAGESSVSVEEGSLTSTIKASRAMVATIRLAVMGAENPNRSKSSPPM